LSDYLNPIVNNRDKTEQSKRADADSNPPDPKEIIRGLEATKPVNPVQPESHGLGFAFTSGTQNCIQGCHSPKTNPQDPPALDANSAWLNGSDREPGTLLIPDNSVNKFSHEQMAGAITQILDSEEIDSSLADSFRLANQGKDTSPNPELMDTIESVRNE
jgi:hypothetical protein